MSDDPDKLSIADPKDVAAALSFGLRFSASSRKRTHDADVFMANIAAERLVEHLRQSGFVVMKRPPTPLATGHVPPTIGLRALSLSPSRRHV
jgi:hypothetical protein